MIEDDQYGNRVKEADGILLDICRLAPVAIRVKIPDINLIVLSRMGERGCGGHGTLLSGPQCLFVSENSSCCRRQELWKSLTINC